MVNSYAGTWTERYCIELFYSKVSRHEIVYFSAASPPGQPSGDATTGRTFQERGNTDGYAEMV